MYIEWTPNVIKKGLLKPQPDKAIKVVLMKSHPSFLIWMEMHLYHLYWWCFFLVRHLTRSFELEICYYAICIQDPLY